MLKALRDLGEVFLKTYGLQKIICEKCLDTPPELTYCISFSEEGEFQGIKLIEDAKNVKEKILLPKKSLIGANVKDFFPLVLTRKPLHNISDFLRGAESFLQDIGTKKYRFERVVTEIKNKSEKIKEEIKRKIPKREKTCLIFRFGDKYAGDFEEIKNAFVKSWLNKIKGGGESRGYCCLCGKEGLVNGDALRYAGWKFATPDKSVFFPGVPKGKKSMSELLPLCIGGKESCFMKVYVAALILWNFAEAKANKKEMKCGNIRFLIVPYLKTGENLEGLKPFADALFYDDSSIDGLITLFPEKENSRSSRIVLSEENLKFLRDIHVIAYVKSKSEVKVVNRATSLEPRSIVKFRKCFREIYGQKKSLLELLRQFVADSSGTDKKDYVNKKAVDCFLALLLNRGFSEQLLQLFYSGFSRVFLRRESRVRSQENFVRYVRNLEKFFKLEELYVGGDGIMGKEVLESPVGKFAYETGKLVSGVMFLQRKIKKEEPGKEPFRSYIASKKIGKLDDLVEIFNKAWEKILQYGGVPSKFTKYSFEDAKKLKGEKMSRRLLTFIFALGIIDGEKEVMKLGGK